MRVRKINGKKVRLGSFGEITRKFHKIYWGKNPDPNCSFSVKDILYNIKQTKFKAVRKKVNYW